MAKTSKRGKASAENGGSRSQQRACSALLSLKEWIKKEMATTKADKFQLGMFEGMARVCDEIDRRTIFANMSESKVPNAAISHAGLKASDLKPQP